MKTVVRESCNFEVAHLKNDFGGLMIFWFGAFAMLFLTLGVFLVGKTFEDDWYIVIKAVHVAGFVLVSLVY